MTEQVSEWVAQVYLGYSGQNNPFLVMSLDICQVLVVSSKPGSLWLLLLHSSDLQAELENFANLENRV